MTETADIRERIYVEYRAKVMGYVRGKISDPHEAEDLVSCAFLKIYQKLDCFDETRASLSTWIYTITKNTVTDHFRTRKTYCEITEDIPYDAGIESAIIEAETLDELACALESLQERERDLIILHYYKGYTLRKIADMMKMSYANAKIIHNKALSHLRAYGICG